MSFLSRSLKTIILSMLAVLLFASVNTISAAEPQLKYSNTAAYLGMRVDVLPKELVAQLPEDILIGQGILVTGFGENSPAEKAGVKAYDIVIAYDRHALMHPSQLIKFVRQDKPGREVKLKLIRKGKALTISVPLSLQHYQLDEDQLDYQYNMQVNGYDGMNIKMYSVDDFEARIRYLAPDGVVRARTFKGTYRGIQAQIYGAKDLSPIAKRDLMARITERHDDEKGWFGDFIPFNDGNFSKDSLKNFGL